MLLTGPVSPILMARPFLRGPREFQPNREALATLATPSKPVAIPAQVHRHEPDPVWGDKRQMEHKKNNVKDYFHSSVTARCKGGASGDNFSPPSEGGVDPAIACDC